MAGKELSSSIMSANEHSTSISAEEVNDHEQTRVMIWATPRANSTVFTKCLSFVPGSQVFMEPYYYCHHALTRLRSLGREVDPTSTTAYDDIEEDEWLSVAEMMSGEKCGGRVDRDMMKYPHIKSLLEIPDPNYRVIFVKDSSYSVHGFYEFLPDKTFNYRHSFLLRHPIRVFTSWRKVMFSLYRKLFPPQGSTFKSIEDFHMIDDVPAAFTPRGLFFKEMYDTWTHVKDSYDSNPVVLDADDLLANPAKMLPKFCSALGIPYTEDLLRWDANPEITDDWINAFSPPNDFEINRIFCRSAYHSSHFFPASLLPREDALTPDVKECVELAMPYYKEMYDSRI